MNTNYNTVIVIGYGVITGHVLQTVYDNAGIYGYEIVYIEYESHPFNQAKKLAAKYCINYCSLTDKNVLLNFFLKSRENGKTLIISASNNYIFPSILVDCEDIDIVNFHNALLPKYPGRNAPSWVIYNSEPETGITWHYVSSDIDTGDIIVQKKIAVAPDIKAYELVSELMNLAADSFDEIFKSILEENAVRIKQTILANRTVYKSFEIPGNGVFDLRDDPAKIYRLLRATDYGKNNIFPKIKTSLNGQSIQIKRYKIVDDMNYANGELNYFIPYNEKFILLKYEIDDSDSETTILDSTKDNERI